LWSRTQARFVVLVACLGGALLSASWLGVARTTDVHTQLGWVALAVLSLVLPVACGGALVLWAHRAIAGRRRRLLGARRVRTRVTPTGFVDFAWYAVHNTVRAHRRGCQLTAGKDVERLPGAPEESGRLPCEVCA
jgi:TRAP-type C4-dicarboxylate transport system permease small subunit